MAAFRVAEAEIEGKGGANRFFSGSVEGGGGFVSGLGGFTMGFGWWFVGVLGGGREGWWGFESVTVVEFGGGGGGCGGGEVAREGEILAGEVFEKGHWGLRLDVVFAKVLVQKM